MLRAIKGTYIYVCDKELRAYFARHISAYRKEKKIHVLPTSKVVPFENAIPVYDLMAAAGGFSELQQVTDYDWVELPARYKPSRDWFACMVVGESMNRVIPNGSLCLFKKYTGGSRDGSIVLVEHTSIQDPDFGSGYTVKEYRSKKHVNEESWGHHSITLRPLSDRSDYAEIEITADELSVLKVIGVFECVLG